MIKTFPKFNKTTLTYFLIAVVFCGIIALFVKIIFPDVKKPSDNYTECNQLLNASAPISPSSVLNDKNDIQLLHARINGIKSPFATNAGFDSLITMMVLNNELIEVKDGPLYRLKSLKHSHPYLVPEAVNMVDEIAFRFQQKLKEKELGNYCFFLTSLLRTEETQKQLSHRNGNATDTTAHYYGTTIDISYKHFYNLDNDSVVPSWELIQELTKTLVEMREECKILAVRERKQSCFHITVVACKPKESEVED